MRDVVFAAASVVVLLLAFPVAAQTTQPAAKLRLEFSPTGLAQLSYGDEQLLDANQSNLPRLGWVSTLDANGLPVSKSETKNDMYAFDPKTSTVAGTYEWGRIVTTYAVVGNRLDIRLKLENTSDKPLLGADIRIAKLLLPDTKYTVGGASIDGAMGIKTLRLASGVMALCNWELKSPVSVSIESSQGNEKGFPVRLLMQPSATPVHKVIDANLFPRGPEPIAPGQSREFHVSLNFGPAGAKPAEYCQDFFEYFRSQRPMLLKWDDRRPIGTIMMAYPVGKWPTNPRGYLFAGKDANKDVHTPEGLEGFRTAMLKYADDCVKVHKAMNAQGVIVWDLEGGEFPHSIMYIGDPRALPKISPEMDKFADEFFKKFTDANLRVGLTIRPTEIYQGDPNIPWWTHRHVKDPVETMSEKIRYARKRWGCTIFYMDSNVQGPGFDIEPNQCKNVPWTMPTQWLAELNRRFPDVLIVPEWENAGYYAYCAPYKAFHGRAMGSNWAAQAVYPNAFSVVAPSEDLMEECWDTYVASVKAGDVLFCIGWYQPWGNDMITLIYREASYLKQGPPEALKAAGLPALTAATGDANERTRYFAADGLGKCADANAMIPLKGLLDDSSLLVRKSALAAMIQHKGAADEDTVAKLMAMLKDKKLGPGLALRAFIARAAGAAGDKAVGPLVTICESNDRELPRYAVEALGLTGTKQPAAVEALLPYLERDNRFKVLACKALGDLKAVSAVEKIIPLMDDKDETVSQNAVIALGRIGDARAVEPMMKLFYRGYRTTVVYWIPNDLDDALKALTGQPIRGRGSWIKWYTASTQPAGKN